MKTLTFIVAMIAATTAAQAWEFPDNPDRFVSVGVNVEKYAASGGQTDVTGPNPGMQVTELGTAKANSNNIVVNFRVPASNSLTVDLTYVDVRGVQELDRSGGEYVSTSHLDGYRASLGLRYYFNRREN